MKPSANHKVPLQPGHTLAVWNATSDKLMQDYWAAKGGKPQGPFTKEDVAKHKTATDAWIVINTRVYDISLYLEYHPGGKDILLGASGKDGTAQILTWHRWVNAEAIIKSCFLGVISNS